MDYPTREQAQAMVKCKCSTNACEICLSRELCKAYFTDVGDPEALGKNLLALHDAIEAKQAEPDALNKVKAELCDKYLERLEELDKAHDLIKRLNDKLKTWCGLVPWANEFIAEANKILGE